MRYLIGAGVTGSLGFGLIEDVALRILHPGDEIGFDFESSVGDGGVAGDHLQGRDFNGSQGQSLVALLRFHIKAKQTQVVHQLADAERCAAGALRRRFSSERVPHAG